MQLWDIDDECIFCEHNMWFVRSDFVRRLGAPSISWRGMVRLFWSQMMNKITRMWCLHINLGWIDSDGVNRATGEHFKGFRGSGGRLVQPLGIFCPLYDVPQLVGSLNNLHVSLLSLAEQSLFLSMPQSRNYSLGYAEVLQSVLALNATSTVNVTRFRKNNHHHP